MKKTLLLSMAASAVLFAGGDIEKVVVPEPVKPCPTSNLKWYGQTVLYYQTVENAATVAANAGTGIESELFDGNTAAANWGLKLGVTGSNLAGTGLGFGLEVVALSTLGLENDATGGNQDYVAAPMQLAGNPTFDAAGNASFDAATLTQAYLTYTMANTTVKVGRTELPKLLSPFAFSESWNVFKNTYEAALVINSDLPDTTLVGAWVYRLNNIGNLGAWAKANNDDGIFMLTAVNKTIEGLTLTGTVYFASEFAGVNNDLVALWGDAKFSMPVAGNTIAFGVQGGTLDVDLADPTMAYGVKASGKFNIPAFGSVALCAAYTGVDLQVAGNPTVTNLGNVKTPLYTQMVLNEGFISGAFSGGTADTMMIKGSATYDLPALGSTTFSVAYSTTAMDTVGGVALSDYNELDVVAKAKIAGAEVLAAYVNTEYDNGTDDANDRDAVRIWAKWNF